MRCSDIQMVIASQIAYMDFNSAAVDSGEYTVGELLEMELESSNPSNKETIEYIQKLMQSDQGKECANLVIKDICNDQKNTGMYACMLETGDGEAMIAFRGSENWKDPDNLLKDWIGSDLGLLNSVLTPQQARAEQYVRDIYAKYGDQYNHFNLTGHSLGGNLAEHATITAPDSMRKKIDRCLNLDGPGVSQTYLAAHADDIHKSQGIIDHYQWSVIGALLNTVPGTNYQTIKAKTPDDQGAMSIVWRHDTRNVVDYDENGNMVPGEKDWLARHAKEISSLLDTLVTMSFPNMINLAILYNFADMSIDQIVNLWEQWKYSSAQGYETEFAVRTGSLYERMDELRNASETVKAIREETESIRKNMSMCSLSTGYLKYKLWRTGNSMERLSKNIQEYASVGENCVQTYQRYDRKIADSY